MDERLLLIPGPTNLSKRVRDTMALPTISHTGTQFYGEFKEVLSLSRYALRNQKGFQFAFSGSGTIGMESSIVSLVERGERVLILETGYFGKRISLLAGIHGAKVDMVQFGDGRHADAGALRKKLSKTKYKAVFLTHVETSTSVCNPIEELVDECSKADTLSVVDAVCSVGGVELDFDRLGADVVFTASQKALAAPPGATIVAASNRALELVSKRKTPVESYYMDLSRWVPVMDDPKIYLTTPAVQVLRALRVALMEVKDEGIQARWARHRALGELARKRVSELGQRFVAEEGYRADTVTSFWVKDGTAGPIQRKLEEESGIVVARGVADNRDKMIRVGHFGTLTHEVLDGAMARLGDALLEVGGAKRTAPIAKHR